MKRPGLAADNGGAGRQSDWCGACEMRVEGMTDRLGREEVSKEMNGVAIIKGQAGAARRGVARRGAAWRGGRAEVR